MTSAARFQHLVDSLINYVPNVTEGKHDTKN